MQSLRSLVILGLVCLFPVTHHAAADMPEAPVQIHDMQVRGEIQETNISFTLSFRAICHEAPHELTLITGDMALKTLNSSSDRLSLRYAPETKTYYILFQSPGEYDVDVTFAARPDAAQKKEWRETVFEIPSAQARQLQLMSDRNDLEVKFPGALRVKRQVVDQQLQLTALLGPDKPFTVQWKPQVAEMKGKLVVASQTNAVVTVRAGALRLDNLVLFDVVQGRLRDMEFFLPDKLNITQVRCPYIRDWKIETSNGQKHLHVLLNRPVADAHSVQILAEQALPEFPAEIQLPVIQPRNVIRATGHVAVGTDSAVQLITEETGRLSQIEPAAFPRMAMDNAQTRTLPFTKAFYYQYATMPYAMKLRLDNIVPSYDAIHRIAVNLKEDDMPVDAEFEIDVRDAPLRQLRIQADRNLVIAGVSGRNLDDYSIHPPVNEGDKHQEIELRFTEAVKGRLLITVHAELGKGPLEGPQLIRGFRVEGADNERGYLVVGAMKGVQIDKVETRALRKVHTASVDLKAVDAQYAYRFRDSNWQLTLTATRKPAVILAEPFHLISIGEGIAYGSIAINYFISGAPVDRFRFTLPERYRNVEFIGSDVRRWTQDGDVWTVELQRKVMGEYNLGVSYNQRYKDGESILAGAVECKDVETQSGFITVTSPLNLKLDTLQRNDQRVLAVERKEIPVHYRTMTRHPVLRSYKYLGTPHHLELRIASYEPGTVLPVLIEVTELKTQMTVNELGQTESVTRISYRVKNTSRQYLPLEMPDNTSYAVARSLEKQTANGVTKSTRMNAQVDKKTGLLMIPLPRRRTLDTPISFELEYGQTHGTAAAFDRIKLRAPLTPTRSTFAEWKVIPPEGYRIRAANDGNMMVRDYAAAEAGLGAVGRLTAKSWLWALSRIDRFAPMFAIFAGGMFVVFIVLAFVSRRSIRPLLLVFILLTVSAVGAFATQAPSFIWQSNQPISEQPVSLVFEQALDLDKTTAIRIGVQLVPEWLQAPISWLTASALIAVVCYSAAFRFKRKRILFALGTWALCFLIAGVAFGGELVAHLLTWGIPMALLALSINHYTRGMAGRIQRRRATMMLLGLAFLFFADPGLTPVTHAMGVARNLPPEYQTNFRHLSCELTAEKDSMLIESKLQFSTAVPFAKTLLPQDVILLSDPELQADVFVVKAKEGYDLKVEKTGNYDVSIRYLAPLPAPDENSRVQRFQMPLPPALSNHVTLHLPETGLEVDSSTAIEINHTEADNSTRVEAIFSPGGQAAFAWRPRTRKAELEETSFFTSMLALVKFDAGLAEGRHLLRFQIAQGQLDEIRARIPDNMTVTAVTGADIGAWRFEPENQQLEIKLSEPATVQYDLTVITQISRDEMPYKAIIQPLVIQKTQQQRGILGIAVTEAVYSVIDTHPPELNLDDFVRDASDLIRATPGISAQNVRNAYRISGPEAALQAMIHAVQPEIRSYEESVFSVSDERLQHSSDFRVTIDKAGVFSVRLRIPDGYDIDTLTAGKVSHWDETETDGERLVRVHFKEKLRGSAELSVALSRPVTDLPKEVTVPRIQTLDAVKHGGHVVVSAERGVRLSAVLPKRRGVSEMDPSELGLHNRNVLAYKLLKPDWGLSMNTEVIEPRINVDFLHVARVSEGRIRHVHSLRYRFFNAGTKYFRIKTPADALGLQITGPEIARIERMETGSGLWQVELNKKWFDRPYNLTVSYESQFDRTVGKVSMPHVQAVGVDLQRGHVVVFSHERIELSPLEVGSGLQKADARNVPAYFRQGDLSGAAFCYHSTDPEYQLAFSAIRHDAADLLEAEVINTTIKSVASERGETINQVSMNLRVGDKRHLELRLPEGGEMWALIVNGAPTIPSIRKNQSGKGIVLIPLAQTASGDLAVNIEFIFVVPPAPEWKRENQQYFGPRFDVPLKNIAWEIYLPENLSYSDPRGTLNADRSLVDADYVQGYGIASYEQQLRNRRTSYLKTGKELQRQGSRMAEAGNVSEAKQLLEWSANYSKADPAQHEDARVQLRNLLQQRSMAGLVKRRDQLRQQNSGIGQSAQQPQLEEPLQYDREALERIQASLSHEDSDNLRRITEQLLENQEAATTSMAQFAIALPVRGRLLRFQRPLQVKVNSPMIIRFNARPAPEEIAGANWPWLIGLLAVFLVLSGAVPKILQYSIPKTKEMKPPPMQEL